VATLAASWVLVALPDLALVVPTVVVALVVLAFPLLFHLLDLLVLAFSLLATSCWMPSWWWQSCAK